MTDRTVTKEDAEAALSGLCWTASYPSNFNKSSVATDRVRTVRTYLAALESQLAEARLAARKEFAEDVIAKRGLEGSGGRPGTILMSYDELRTLAAKPKE